MLYSELKESILEIIDNSKIHKNNMSIEYKLSAIDFNRIYLDFIKEFGGDFNSEIKHFDIKSVTNVTFRIINNG